MYGSMDESGVIQMDTLGETEEECENNEDERKELLCAYNWCASGWQKIGVYY